MKKLLVLYATYGSGHKAVAMYIKDYYAAMGYEVMTIDILSYTIPILGMFTKRVNEYLMTTIPSLWTLLYFISDNPITASVYQKLSLKLYDNKNLRQTIVDFNPDLIIATHFYASGLIAKYKQNNIIDSKFISVITDYKAHEVWLKEVKNTDAVVVSSYEEKRKLLKYGFKSNQISTSGIPILPNVSDIDKDKLLKKFKLSGKRPIILFFCGGANGATNNLKYLKVLLKEQVNADLLLIAGKSKKAKEKAKNIVKKYNAKNVKVYGFVTNISEFYKISDFVITKPGGTQATECLYYRKPMIFIKSNGGQEIENRLFFIKKGYALGFLSSVGFINQVNKLLNNKKLLNKMIKNIDKIKQEKSMEKLFKMSEKLLK